jgi:hypothetical protein
MQMARPEITGKKQGVSPDNALPLLLRIREAARELNVCERSIHNFVEQNLLEKVKLGAKSVRITRSSVLKLAQHARDPPTPA